MKKLNLIIMTLVAVMALAACNDGVTYADLKKKERNAINRYITSHKIQKITEAEFEKKGFVTDTTKNEYVLFESTGVYMQIVRKGGGEKLKDGETATVLCRFKEYNILEGDSALQLTNITQYSWQVDKMSVKNTSGTFTGSFISGESLMYSKYSTQAVPVGLARSAHVYQPRTHSEGRGDSARTPHRATHTGTERRFVERLPVPLRTLA